MKKNLVPLLIMSIVFSACKKDSQPTLPPNHNEVTVLSAACVATGIVLFSASERNKKKVKASSVFIDMQKSPVLHQTEIRNQSFPVLGLRLNL